MHEIHPPILRVDQNSCRNVGLMSVTRHCIAEQQQGGEQYLKGAISCYITEHGVVWQIQQSYF